MNWLINFFKGVWNVVKSMGNWKGILSLFLVWFIISGAGVSVIGIIIKNSYLIGLGGIIYGFWLLPLTPLMLITIILAMLMQKYVFRDKSVSVENIKNKFNEVKEKEFDIKENYIFYAKVDKRMWLR